MPSVLAVQVCYIKHHGFDDGGRDRRTRAAPRIEKRTFKRTAITGQSMGVAGLNASTLEAGFELARPLEFPFRQKA